MPKTNLLKTEHGSSLIEFAPVLLVLLALTFGMIDLGRYIYAISSVHASAQEAARAGAHLPKDELDTLQTVAEDMAESTMVALDTSKAVVTAIEDGVIVTVDITYQFEFITPLLAAAINGPIEISSRASDSIY